MSRPYGFRAEPERPLEPKPWPAPPVCPICDAECEQYVRHQVTGVIVGCDVCLEFYDPLED